MNKIEARKRRGAKTKALIKKSNRHRLVVHKSANNIYAQVSYQGDNGDVIIASCSTLDKELRQELTGNKCDNALAVGKLLGKRMLDKNVSEVAFDRAGYKYHGRIKALADGARESGVNF